MEKQKILHETWARARDWTNLLFVSPLVEANDLLLCLFSIVYKLLVSRNYSETIPFGLDTSPSLLYVLHAVV